MLLRRRQLFAYRLSDIAKRIQLRPAAFDRGGRLNVGSWFVVKPSLFCFIPLAEIELHRLRCRYHSPNQKHAPSLMRSFDSHPPQRITSA